MNLLSQDERNYLLRRMKYGPALPREELPNFMKHVLENEMGINIAERVNSYVELNTAIRNFLWRFAHRRCGGTPVAYVNEAIECSKCKRQYKCPHGEPLGRSLEHAGYEEVNPRNPWPRDLIAEGFCERKKR